MLRIQAEMYSDIGRRRESNEDTVDFYIPAPHEPSATLGTVFALADGVGSSGSGAIASREAVHEVIRAYYDKTLSPPLTNITEDIRTRLQNAVQAANQTVHQIERTQDTRHMATTLVFAAIRRNTFAVAHVGDSPAFLIRNNQIRKLTTDHNFAEMQYRTGRLSKEEANLHPDRNKLVRSVGRLATVDVDVLVEPVQPCDYLLLCSDGLTRYVQPQELLTTLQSHPLDEAVRMLGQQANARGGSDNISIIAIQVLPDNRLRSTLQVLAIRRRLTGAFATLSNLIRAKGSAERIA